MSPCSVEAEIRYLTPEEGGRRTPVATGYRGQFHYETEPEMVFDATQSFPDVPQGHYVPMGQPVAAVVVFPADRWHEHHSKHLRIGTRFQIREGRRVVGHGVVTKVPGR